MEQQPTTHVVVVQHQPEDLDHDRCFFCCCRCCHIKTACLVLLTLCLLSVIYTLYKTGTALAMYSEVPPGILGMESLNIIQAVILLISSLLCFVAIGTTRPRLVIPHVVALIVSSAIALINSILAIAVIATSAEWFFGVTDEESRQQIERYRDAFVGIEASASATSLIISNIIEIVFAIYFVFLFLKLKRYLQDVRGRSGSSAMYHGKAAQPPAYPAAYGQQPYYNQPQPGTGVAAYPPQYRQQY